MQFEITIKDGKLHIEGPGGFYGFILPLGVDGVTVPHDPAGWVLSSIAAWVRAETSKTERNK